MVSNEGDRAHQIYFRWRNLLLGVFLKWSQRGSEQRERKVRGCPPRRHRVSMAYLIPWGWGLGYCTGSHPSWKLVKKHPCPLNWLSRLPGTHFQTSLQSKDESSLFRSFWYKVERQVCESMNTTAVNHLLITDPLASAGTQRGEAAELCLITTRSTYAVVPWTELWSPPFIRWSPNP